MFVTLHWMMDNLITHFSAVLLFLGSVSYHRSIDVYVNFSNNCILDIELCWDTL